jgi:hypothetical protein
VLPVTKNLLVRSDFSGRAASTLLGVPGAGDTENAGEVRSGGDWRLTVIAAGILLLGGVVGAVVLSGGESGPEAAAPPPGCIERWNSDPAARAFGIHNYGSHRYTRVQMLLLDTRGRPSERGDCGVVFAAQSLDPEPGAAAQVHVGGQWQALIGQGTSGERLGELQSEALANANATLGPAGTIRSD